MLRAKIGVFFLSLQRMLTRIYADNPSERELRRVAEVLERDGIIIYPTDSLYAFGCSIHSVKGIERLRRMTGKSAASLSVIFADLKQVAEYCRVDNAAFRILKRNLPGPFTFILNASSRVPDKALERRKTIGVRIPDNGVAHALVEMLGAPLISASLPLDDEEPEYATNPELMEERFGREVAMVVDGGEGLTEPTTIVDLTTEIPEIVREGRGELK